MSLHKCVLVGNKESSFGSFKYQVLQHFPSKYCNFAKIARVFKLHFATKSSQNNVKNQSSLLQLWYFPNIILLLTFKFVDVSRKKLLPLMASWSPGDKTKHIAQLRSYTSSTCRRGAQVFRLGTSESTKGWEWTTWGGWEACGTDIFSPFQLVANNRRGSNLWESLRYFFGTTLDFVILFGMQESGMPRPSQNAWDI